MENPARLLHQLKRRVQSVTYGSPLYRMMLDQGPVPEKVRLSLPDPWPGDSQRGQALIASQPGLFDAETLRCENMHKCFLTHDCLRDLRAVGTEMARRKAIAIIHEWIEDSSEAWDEDGWSPPVLGARLANWIAFHDFYAPAANRDFIAPLLLSATRQLRHLENTAHANLIGLDGLRSVKGLVFGGLALTDSEKAVGLGIDLLLRQIHAEILPDGGHISRSPLVLAEIVRGLIDIRIALCAAHIEVPHELSLAITRMVPALKLLRHGDGGLALFNGGAAGNAVAMDAMQTLSGAKGRLAKSLPQTGYERLTAGRSLLIVDVAPPPPRPYDSIAHAGLASFEFSVGKERLFTNCGAAPPTHPQWSRAMAATAAHNTVILEDTNACELLPDGGIGHRPTTFETGRYEVDNVQFVEIAHDSYAPRYKTRLERILSLSNDGDEVQCLETIHGPCGHSYTIRWHLHPDVKALMAQDDGSALLRTPSGLGWRLRVEGTEALVLSLEPSIYCGDGAPRRTVQLCLSGSIGKQGTKIKWNLCRETNRKGA